MKLKLLSQCTEERFSELTLQFPWPILTKGIEATLKSDKSIVIVAKKCLDDAFPGDYGGRSKWDINRFLPWKQFVSECPLGHLRDHIEAQFDSRLFRFMTGGMKDCKPLTILGEVREIIRAIFYGHYNNSFQLMAVHGVEDPDNPVFFIRIHPPVRFSPHGSPLLLLSVIDYPRLEELIEHGKVDREAFQSDFHRLVTERVSKEVCIIRATTKEEIHLLRYVLRVNSTKMRRSVWQSRNLPRGEDHPWISTFISPLYDETITGNILEFMKEENKSGFSHSPFNPANDPNDSKSCGYCHVTKILLKMCSRCHCVTYCSISCQKGHWPSHKSFCPRLSSRI